MGDVIHAFAWLSALKAARPDVTVDWVVSDVYAELARLTPHVDRLIPFRRQGWRRWWRPSVIGDLLRFRRSLRDNGYDAAVDLQGLLRSGLVTGATGAPIRIGFANAREGAPFFYTDTVPVPDDDVPAVERYLSTLAPLGVAPPAEATWDVTIPDADRADAGARLPDRPYVVINPNARWETKRWSTDRFAETARLLRKRHGLTPVIVGGPDEKRRGAEVAGLIGDDVRDLTGAGGFGFLAAVMKKSAGVVTNDSGPMHLAVAVGAPVVALFGPTHPTRTGPYGGRYRIVATGCDRAPCYKRSCPIGAVCLDTVTPEQVVTAWEGLALGSA